MVCCGCRHFEDPAVRRGLRRHYWPSTASTPHVRHVGHFGHVRGLTVVSVRPNNRKAMVNTSSMRHFQAHFLKATRTTAAESRGGCRLKCRLIIGPQYLMMMMMMRRYIRRTEQGQRSSRMVYSTQSILYYKECPNLALNNHVEAANSTAK